MAVGSKKIYRGSRNYGLEGRSTTLITGRSIVILQNIRGMYRRGALYCLLLTACCLLFSACDGRRDRDIGPDTARRELFLRGYAYREPDFLDAAKDGREVGVKLFLIAGMS